MRKGKVVAALIGAAAMVVAGAAAAGGHTDGHARTINIATHSGASASQHMDLALSKAAIVQLDVDARDVLVSDPSIVNAVVRTPRRIFLLAEKTGQTNAFFFDAAGHQILSLDIRVERDVNDLQAMMHQFMPDASIRVSALNDNVVLTGTVANAGESTRAADLAGRFAGSADKVVNMLKIVATEQVLLKVKVAEMERSISKQLGINLATEAVAAGVPIIASTSNPFGLIGKALADASGAQIGSLCTIAVTGKCTGGPNNFEGALQALEQYGLIHTLAEPNMIAVSGETAKFLAGGEFPVPSSRDQYGNVVVVFKQFGVGLSFTPVVLSENRISLQISTEVSELSNEGAFFSSASGSSTPTDGTTSPAASSSGLTVPALEVRRAQTTIELPSGGSFAIAGLLQHTNKQVIDEFPGLGKMPVLGALFRSRDFQDDQTELVVLASAYLVNPTSETKYSSPTDGFQSPSDPDTILNGTLNRVHGPDTVAAKSAPAGNAGYIVQ